MEKAEYAGLIVWRICLIVVSAYVIIPASPFRESLSTSRVLMVSSFFCVGTLLIALLTQLLLLSMAMVAVIKPIIAHTGCESVYDSFSER